MEDLKYLLKNEQIELRKAQEASCDLARSAHRFLAREYARRISGHSHPYRSGSIKSRTVFAPYPFGSEGLHS